MDNLDSRIEVIKERDSAVDGVIISISDVTSLRSDTTIHPGLRGSDALGNDRMIRQWTGSRSATEEWSEAGIWIMSS